MGLFDLLKKSKTKAETKNETVIEKQQTSHTVNTKPYSNFSIGEPDVIPVSERLKTAFACKHGLFPHEILVLEYAHSYLTSGNQFQGFWWYKYGVSNVQAVINSLVERRFIMIGGLEETIRKQTGSVLKELLKEHNLKQTGKKAELVQRVMLEIPESELNHRFPQRTYVVTKLGQEVIDANKYVMYVHRRPYEGLDIWSLNQLVFTKPYYPYRDKIWAYLNERSMKYARDNDWGLYRNCRFAMSQFLQEEERFKDALGMLAEVVFYDLSGMSNGFDMRYLDITAQHLFPYEGSFASTAPGIISAIFACADNARLSEDELKSLLLDSINKMSAPLTLFTPEESISIIFYERDGNKDALDSMYEKAKIRFKRKFPQIDLRKK